MPFSNKYVNTCVQLNFCLLLFIEKREKNLSYFFFTKHRLCSTCVGIIMIGEGETWPVKEGNVIRFGRNYARMVR